MMILVSLSVFKVKESDGVIYFDRDLSRSRPLQNHILGYISVTDKQKVAKCYQKVA